MQQFTANVPLMKGLVTRKDLLDTVYVEELLEIRDDDVMSLVLEHHGNSFQWSGMLIDSIFARIYSGDFMTGVAFSSVENLPLDAIDNVIDTSPIAGACVSRRDDLPIPIRDKLLQLSEEATCGVLRSEDRPEVLSKYFNLDIRYDESIASNPHLCKFYIVSFMKASDMRQSLFDTSSEKAFRVHRSLALRDDLTSLEIDQLLLKRDLDIYHNLCINKKVSLTKEQVNVLVNLAQTSKEEQEQWLPCLKMMHKGKDDDELCEMLMSYQSEMRLLLQQRDKEMGTNYIDEEMTIAWTSDPDFSITMGKEKRILTDRNYQFVYQAVQLHDESHSRK